VAERLLAQLCPLGVVRNHYFWLTSCTLERHGTDLTLFWSKPRNPQLYSE